MQRMVFMNKIGIMGGSFNPIHNGHLFLAENAYEQAGLNKVLFMPLKNPPHKIKLNNITDQQRVDMVKLAIQNNSHFELSEIELQREGMSYTADTLTYLKEKNPEDDYYFIVGTDSLFYMHNWMKPEVVFDLCTVVAAGRDNAEEDRILSHIDFLKKTYNARIIYVKMPMIELSSEGIRERLATGRTVRYYIPDAVIEYINSNQLYQICQEDIKS